MSLANGLFITVGYDEFDVLIFATLLYREFDSRQIPD